MPTPKFLGGEDRDPQPASGTTAPFRAPRGGRPIELDERLIQTVERAIGQGQTLKGAAWCAGISAGTLSTWLADGQRDDCSDPMRRELFQRCAVARGNQQMWGVQVLKDIAEAGGAGAVQAAIKLLEAQDPETWGSKTTQRVEVQHSEAPGSARALEGYSLEEKRELARIIAAKNARLSAGPDAEG